jgi:hypothetical protein
MQSPLAMLGAFVLALVFALVGVYFQLVPHNPDHPVSYHAIAFWGLAVVALIGASFARPREN